MIRKSGEITYTLNRKNVKNINLRIKDEGKVYVSANNNVPISKIDDFILKKSKWILDGQKRIKENVKPAVTCCDEECLKKFNQISDEIYPYFKECIKEKPLIKVKTMKSCWGICHYKKGYITLNKLLIAKPIEAIQYVILHEYVHFIEPNHQAGFHKIMGELMPDYKNRKSMLR